MHLKVSSSKWRPFCLALNVLMNEENCLVTPPLANWDLNVWLDKKHFYMNLFINPL